MVHRMAAAAVAVVLVGGAVGGGAWVRADRAADAAEADREAHARSSQVLSAFDGDVGAWSAVDSGAVAAGSTRAQTAAHDELAAAVAAARTTLDTTAGAVTDDATRQVLAELITTTDGTTSLSPTTARALTAQLATAAAAVTASHDQYVQQQAAAAAKAAAPAATATKPKATTAAPSCGTTYTGPPFYTSPPTEGGDGSNGKLPPSALTAISWDVDPHGTPYYLKNAAAAALERLDVAFRAAFGHHLDLDLTYRDYDTQVAMRQALGTVAAVPGTSSHGTGLALDLPELPCEYGYGTAQRDWIVKNGPSYGWVAPSWARQGGSNPEYWHFEYVG